MTVKHTLHIRLTLSVSMDTGTTLALIDDKSCKAIYDAIPGAKYDKDQAGYVFPSNTPRDSLPVVNIAIGDHNVVIDKDDIGFADMGTGWMYGGFQSRGNMTFSIYGGSVLKSMYAIFDQVCDSISTVLKLKAQLKETDIGLMQGKKRFGFAQKADLQANK